MSKSLGVFSGIVENGIGKGSKIGFPTINVGIIHFSGDAEFGVYACYVEIDNWFYKGVVHYGPKSIGAGDNKKIFFEVHILDFDSDVYGKEVSVNLLKKIRDVREFKSDEDLIRQIKKDIVIANKYFQKNAE